MTHTVSRFRHQVQCMIWRNPKLVWNPTTGAAPTNPKSECLFGKLKLILFGEPSLRHVLQNYAPHYHQQSDHQVKDNLIHFM